jgi:epoxide hydrolase 4
MIETLTAKMINLNGACYHVRYSETGKESVLLIHGWPDDSTVWKYQVTALIENGYRVICPDLLGYGLSEAPTDLTRYQLPNLVDDMITLLNRMEVTKVHCVAHDYGAVLGWELAVRAKQLKSYTAMSVGHLAEFLKLSHENLRFQWIYFLNIHNLAPQLYRANNSQFFYEVLRTHPNREQLVENIVKPGVFENMQNLEKANPVPEYLLAVLTGQLPKPIQINVPTLGIWSTKDDFLWESQMKDSEQYVSAEWQYERIEDAGHWFMLERSRQINQLLLNWLAKHT